MDLDLFKIDRVQDFIINLYNLKNNDGSLNSAARKMKTKDSNNNWKEELKDFTEKEIIEVIRKYHKEVNNVTPPLLYKISDLLKNNKKEQPINSELKKPICDVKKWQEDFDYVLQQACTYGIVYNPYWVSKGYKSIGETYVRDIQGNLTKKTWKMYWKDALSIAKNQEPEKFSMISKFDDYMLEYTLAYRLKFLKI